MPSDVSHPILVVDDDAGFRSYLSELFTSIGYRTEQRDNGAAVMPAVESDRPAVILLDIELPGLNGYEICRELRDRYGETIAIVFISGERTEPFDRAAGLLVGADDYVVKPVDPGELIARVRRLIERADVNGSSASTDPRLGTLTPREHEVLDLLAEGCPQEEIARRLVISPKTVATHIQRILGKLQVRSRAQAVALALRNQGDVSAHILESGAPDV